VSRRDLAAALLEPAYRDEQRDPLRGCAGHGSRCELAFLLAQAHGLSGEPILRAWLERSAVGRPANCALDSSRARWLLEARLHGVFEYAAAASTRP